MINYNNSNFMFIETAKELLVAHNVYSKALVKFNGLDKNKKEKISSDLRWLENKSSVEIEEVSRLEFSANHS